MSESSPISLLFQLVHTAGVSRQEKEDFQRQCRTLQTLSHDVVLPLLGVFPFGDYFLFAHEETPFVPLRQLLGTPFSTLDALLLVEHTTRALGVVHAQGIAYQTLTPDTLHVAPYYERVRLGVPHFPLAIGRDEKKGSERWAYVAPEQIICATESELYMADFYALGMLLYEMLLGQTPLPKAGQVEVFQAHLEGEPLVRVQQLTHVPLCVRQVLSTLLAPLPTDRYHSAAGVLHDVQWCQRIVSGQEDGDDFATRSRDISASYYYSDTLFRDGESTEVLLEALERIVEKGTPEMLLITGENGAGKTTVVRRALAQYAGEVRVAYFPIAEASSADTPSADTPSADANHVLQQLLVCINKSAAMPSVPSGKQGAGRAVPREKRPFADAQAGKEKEVIPQPTAKRNAGQSFLSMVQEETENDDATKADIEFLLCQGLAVLAGGRSVAAVVIDNMHNAPAAFMHIWMSCIGRSRMLPILFIGIADNKLAVSSLPDYLRTLAYQDIPVGTTALFPLEVPHIRQLIADTFGASLDGAELLAELTHRKTSGNPKAIRSFWDSLVAMQVLRFSFGHWRCDIMRLRDMQIAGSLPKVLAKVSEYIPYRMLGDLLTALAMDDMVQTTVVQSLQREIDQYKQHIQHSDMYIAGMQSIARWIADVSSDVLLLFDVVEQRVIFSHRSLAQLLGYGGTHSGMHNTEADQLFHPRDEAILWAVFRELCAVGKRTAVRRTMRLRTAGGAWQWCTVWGVGVLYADAHEARFVFGGLTIAARELGSHGE